MSCRMGSAALALAVLASAGCANHRQTPLMAAAVQGDLRGIKSMIAQGTHVNEQDPEGCAAIHWAARAGRLDSIALLLRLGADPNLRGGVNGWTPVMHAIHKNRTRAALALLDAGADPNRGSPNGFTPLLMAAGYGYTDMVRALLERGADPRAEGPYGQTALSAAVGGVPDIDRFTVGNCQTSTVRALLEEAPDLELKNNFSGSVALLVARWSGCKDVLEAVESISYLINPCRR